MALTYMSEVEKAANNQYRHQWTCAAGQSGKQCDEFPFFSTAEGWPVANPPDLLPIDALDNRLQGYGGLQPFYRKCQQLKVGAVGVDRPRFLVVPLPPGLTWYPYCGSVSN